MSGLKYIIIGISSFISVLLIGTLGYMYIENWPFLDAFYMTVITLSTVGFSERYPLSQRGEVFTIIIILLGVGVTIYLFGSVAQLMIEGRFKTIFERRAMEKKIKSLKNHYVICGYGRIGQHICKHLQKHKVPFVIIDKDYQVAQKAQEEGFLCVEGEATKEEVLLKAGIKNALGLISVVGFDADNVYIILTAKDINSSLRIISRAAEEEAVKKLKKAGANKVISPYNIGAHTIARIITHPLITDFLALTIHEGIELQMEEIPIGQGTKIKDVNLQQSSLRQRFDVIVVAIKKSSGEMLFNPSSETVISCGDILIVLGKPDKLKELEVTLDSISYSFS
jgi:voltage-gated potassium channel